PANAADSVVLPDLLHGRETRVWGDQAYRQSEGDHQAARAKGQRLTNRRYRHRGIVDETERRRTIPSKRCLPRLNTPLGLSNWCLVLTRRVIPAWPRTPTAWS